MNERAPTFSGLICPPQARLAVINGRAVLPPNAAGLTTPIAPNYVNLLQTEAQIAAPRQINFWSENSFPFDVQISWTAGGGLGGRLRFTASGGGITFYVRCRTVDIWAGNWSNNNNTVQVSIEDGVVGQVQDLHRVTRGLALAPAGAVLMGVPSYARQVRVAASTNAQTATLRLDMMDDAGVPAVQEQFFADAGWVPVGAASLIQLTNTGGAAVASWVADFILGYR